MGVTETDKDRNRFFYHVRRSSTRPLRNLRAKVQYLDLVCADNSEALDVIDDLSLSMFGMNVELSADPKQSEVQQRLAAIEPTIRAQVEATHESGHNHHSARLLVDSDVQCRSNAAKHIFDQGSSFAATSCAEFRRLQRGRSRRPASAPVDDFVLPKPLNQHECDVATNRDLCDGFWDTMPVPSSETLTSTNCAPADFQERQPRCLGETLANDGGDPCIPATCDKTGGHSGDLVAMIGEAHIRITSIEKQLAESQGVAKGIECSLLASQSEIALQVNAVQAQQRESLVEPRVQSLEALLASSDARLNCLQEKVAAFDKSIRAGLKQLKALKVDAEDNTLHKLSTLTRLKDLEQSVCSLDSKMPKSKESVHSQTDDDVCEVEQIFRDVEYGKATKNEGFYARKERTTAWLGLRKGFLASR